MSVHRQLLDITKAPEKAVPRENLDDEGFKTRVEMWREYLADAVDGPKIEVEKFTEYVEVRGMSVASGEEFKFPIQFERNIETAYGLSKGCELERIDFYPKPSGEQIRSYYLVKDLPKGKQNDSFATDEEAKTSITITYEAKTNSEKNICLNIDKYGYTNEGSPRMIPIFIQ